MSRRQARYHALGAFASLWLVTSGVTGMFLAGTNPTPPPVNPCDVRMTVTPSPSSTPTVTPVTASPTPDPSVSSVTASPSPSSSALGRMCVRVQPLSGSPVPPGRNARYAIWVWFAGTGTGDAIIGVTATPGRLSPVFTVCPWPGTATCPVAASSQPVELVAQVAVPQRHAGTRLMLIATAISPQAAAPAAAWGSVAIRGLPKPAPTPAASRPAPAGVGVTVPPPTLPPATLPSATPPAAAPPSASLPALPGPVAGPGTTFPGVTPQPTTAQPARPPQATDASAQFPLSTRAIGGQLAGLAVLFAGTTIAIARLSLRRKRPRPGKDASVT